MSRFDCQADRPIARDPFVKPDLNRLSTQQVGLKSGTSLARSSRSKQQHRSTEPKGEAPMSTTAIPQTTATTTTWNIDRAHSVVEFRVKHMMIAHVKGHFS